VRPALHGADRIGCPHKCTPCGRSFAKWTGDEAAVPALSITLRDRLLNRSLNGFAAIGGMLANISVGFTKAVSLCMAVTVQQESRGRLGRVWPMTRRGFQQKSPLEIYLSRDVSV